MGDCNVCLNEFDGDQASVYNEAFIVARKDHQCYECQETIKAGTQYERVKGLWDGGWATYRFCPTCSDISTSLSCDGSRLFGYLWEDIRENVFPEMTRACIQKLTTAAAKKVLTDRWNEWKFKR